jgi:N-acetylglutamate synthase-like GNAT family acetyltransferase
MSPITTGLTVRSARESDADAVFSLLGQLSQSYAPERDAFDVTFASFVADDSYASLLVAEDAVGTVRGYALTTVTRLLYTNGNSAQLQELVVDAEVHGQGIGSALLEATELECKSHGVRQLTVPSRRAAGFYERLGYRSTADFLKRTFD